MEIIILSGIKPTTIAFTAAPQRFLFVYYIEYNKHSTHWNTQLTKVIFFK